MRDSARHRVLFEQLEHARSELEQARAAHAKVVDAEFWDSFWRPDGVPLPRYILGTVFSTTFRAEWRRSAPARQQRAREWYLRSLAPLDEQLRLARERYMQLSAEMQRAIEDDMRNAAGEA